MNDNLDISKVKDLLGRRAGIEAQLGPINAEYEAMKQSVLDAGEHLQGAGWQMMLRIFEARTGRKNLRTELISVNTEIRANTGRQKLTPVATWLLLVKLEAVSELINEGDPAYDAFHDVFDWVDENYRKNAEYVEEKRVMNDLAEEVAEEGTR